MSTLPVPKQVVVDVLIFMTLCLPMLGVLLWGQPVRTGFWCRDESLTYPYKPDTIPQSALMVIGFGGPFLVMAITESVRAVLKSRVTRQFRTDMYCLAKAYGIFLFGVAANCIFTDTVKFSVGRLRPHFFDLCKPDFDKINCTSHADGMDRFVLDYECTNTMVDSKLIRDSGLSFPSGHASLSVYSAIFTILYLQLRMEVSFSHLLRPTLQLCLMLLAVLCCVTRVNDHKHFTTDVIAGSLIGLTFGWLTFYKLGSKLIPNVEKSRNACMARALSVESEPQTPTPLLRPERLVLNHHNNYRHSSAGPVVSKEDFVNRV